MAYVTLKRVDPMSVAKIEAAIGAVAGFLIFLLIGVVVSMFSALSMGAGALAGIGVILPVVGLVLGAVAGFIFAYIAASIYNFLAGAIGGVRVDLVVAKKMNSLEHIGIQSYAKILAAFFVIGGLIAGILITLVGSGLMLGMVGGLLGLSIIVLPIIGLVLGIVIGVIHPAVYNLIAGKIGGVKFMLKGSNGGELTNIDPMQYAKIVALLEVVFGFIGALLTLAGGLHGNSGAAVGVSILIVAPIVDGIFGFVFGFIFALFYNFIAKRIGGVKFVLGN